MIMFENGDPKIQLQEKPAEKAREGTPVEYFNGIRDSQGSADQKKGTPVKYVDLN